MVYNNTRKTMSLYQYNSTKTVKIRLSIDKSNNLWYTKSIITKSIITKSIITKSIITKSIITKSIINGGKDTYDKPRTTELDKGLYLYTNMSTAAKQRALLKFAESINLEIQINW